MSLLRSPLPGRPLAEIQAATLVMLTRALPDPLATTIIVERLGAPPSSVRRALERLVAEGHVERVGRGCRAVRPSAPVSATLRPGRLVRRLGFRAVWLEHLAAEQTR